MLFRSFLPATKPRPYNAWTAKSANFTIAAADAGQAYDIDTTGGAITVTLPLCSSFLPGDTITLFKTSDDSGAVNVTRSGSDQIDGATSISFRSKGAVVVLSTDGVSAWHIVYRKWFAGDMIQRQIAYDTTRQTLTAQIPSTAAPTTSNGTNITPLTLTLTPKSAYSNIRVRGIIPASLVYTGATISVAVFSTVSATATLRGVAGIASYGSSVAPGIVTIDCQFTSGTTSNMTINVYLGPSAGTLYYLGDHPSGTALWGGNARAMLEVIEEAV